MYWISFGLGFLIAAPFVAIFTTWLARRKLARARILTARAKAQEHLAELGTLTGGLAHEIKNPLSTIKLNLQLLCEDLRDSESDLDRRRFNRLLRLQDEVQRLHNILDEFLRFVGQHELQAGPVDLRGVLEEVAEFFRPQAQSKRVLLRVSLPAEPVVCNLDVTLTKQAVLNLMLNAVQAMPQGGELLLRLTQAAQEAVLEVIDTGPGMAPEVKRRIFEAYFTTRPGGTGLGLPTTRRIVQRHSGDIRVDSEPGKGTRFVVSLPLARR
jgi:signal transduction histidine kinase